MVGGGRGGHPPAPHDSAETTPDASRRLASRNMTTPSKRATASWSRAIATCEAESRRRVASGASPSSRRTTTSASEVIIATRISSPSQVSPRSIPPPRDHWDFSAVAGLHTWTAPLSPMAAMLVPSGDHLIDETGHESVVSPWSRASPEYGLHRTTRVSEPAVANRVPQG